MRLAGDLCWGLAGDLCLGSGFALTAGRVGDSGLAGEAGSTGDGGRAGDAGLTGDLISSPELSETTTLGLVTACRLAGAFLHHRNYTIW